MNLFELLQHYADKSPQSEVKEENKSLTSESTSIIQKILPQSDINLPAFIINWPENWQEAYEERAAIMEYDGHMNRQDAEKEAEQLQRKSFRRQQSNI